MSNRIVKQLERLKTERALLWSLVLVLVAVIMWLLVGILGTRKEQTISAELREMAKPLVPSLDRDVLGSLGERQYFSKEDLLDFAIFALIELEYSSDKQLMDIVNDRTISRPGSESSQGQSGLGAFLSEEEDLADQEVDQDRFSSEFSSPSETEEALGLELENVLVEPEELELQQ